MDINPQRLEESGDRRRQAGRRRSASPATVETYSDQREALDGADFVVVAFQIGGYEPCTVTDFEVPKKYGLRQTIADTLGVGGIMRGLRTVPHLWSICEDMLASAPTRSCCNTSTRWRSTPGRSRRNIRRSGRSASATRCRARRWNWRATSTFRYEEIRYRAAGINHMAFYLKFEQRQADGTYRDLYPDLVRAYREGRAPKPTAGTRAAPTRCATRC